MLLIITPLILLVDADFVGVFDLWWCDATLVYFAAFISVYGLISLVLAAYLFEVVLYKVSNSRPFWQS